jgi:hypothetical protein
MNHPPPHTHMHLPNLPLLPPPPAVGPPELPQGRGGPGGAQAHGALRRLGAPQRAPAGDVRRRLQAAVLGREVCVGGGDVSASVERMHARADVWCSCPLTNINPKLNRPKPRNLFPPPNRTLGRHEPLLELGGHSHWVWAARFNLFHDQLLASASTDSTVCLYHTPGLARMRDAPGAAGGARAAGGRCGGGAFQCLAGWLREQRINATKPDLIHSKRTKTTKGARPTAAPRPLTRDTRTRSMVLRGARPTPGRWRACRMTGRWWSAACRKT